MRFLLLALLVSAALAGCRSPGADCRPLDGWRQGGSGVAALPGCVNSAYREAHELGRSLFELRQERASIDVQIAARPEATGELRRRQRQLDIDIEALEGLAVVERWNIATP